MDDYNSLSLAKYRSCNTGCVVVIIQQGNAETERTKLEERQSWCSTMAVSPSPRGMKKSM
jgi:hypothetical protein